MIGPRSTLTGATPVPRETEHYFLLLPKLADPLLDWLKSRRGWRKHVQNMAIGFVEEGLIDRPITRDLDWGIPLRQRRTRSGRESGSTSGSRR